MALQPVIWVVGLGDIQNSNFSDLNDVSVLRLDMES